MHAKHNGHDNISPPRNRPSTRSVLFINQYVVGESRMVYRPDRSTVSSYVQRLIRHKKRVRATVRLKPAISKHLTFENRSTAQAKHDERNPVGRLDPHDVPLCSSAASSVSEGYSPDHAGNDQCWNQVPRSLYPLEMQPATDPLSSQVLDGLAESQNAGMFLRYYLDHFILRALSSPWHVPEHVQWITANASLRQELLFAVLALGAMLHRTSLASPENCHGTVDAQHSVVLKLAAVTYLQSAIFRWRSQGEGAVTVAYCVMCLTMTEMIEGNMPALKSHSKALEHLLSEMASRDHTPVHVLDLLVSTYHLSCLVTEERPIPLSFPTPEPADTRNEKTHPSTCGPGNLCQESAQFPLELSLQSFLGQDLVNIFVDIKTFIRWRETHILNQLKPSPAESNSLHSTWWKSQHLLLDLPQYDHSPQNMCNAHQYTLRESFRIAILIFWTASSQIHQPGSMIYRTLSAQLMSALGKYAGVPSLWDDFQDLLLWILHLGAFITQDQMDHQWYIDEIVQGLRQTGNVHIWKELETIFNHFLYTERIFHAGVKRIWDRVISLVHDAV